MLRSYIRGVGSYVPPRVVTNDELSRLMSTSDEWIRTRTGIVERRYADEGVLCSDLALEASQRALADAGLAPSDLDFILFATLSPDHHFPGTGCYLQAKMGTSSIGCLDVRNQCTGFLYALSAADAFIRASVYENILVVGAEIHSSALDFTDRGRDVAVLFGDGAGAVVLSRYDGAHRGILHTELHADGRHARALCMDVWDISKKPYITRELIDSPALWPRMDGKTVFKHAVTELIKLFQQTIARAQVRAEDIKYVILSHLHLDHAGCVGLFPNAKYIVQRDELHFAYAPDHYMKAAYIRKDFDKDVPWVIMEGWRDDRLDLFLDGSIFIYFTPGHTPGHQSILVNLHNSGPMFFAADSCYTMENINEDVLPGLMWNAGETVRSVQRMKNLRDLYGATIVTGHDPEAWKQFKQAPGYYD
ncbi:MAG: beta-ketoacyl-ACP synthase 3 [Syntrophobacteraceae bacterium]|nr:beta-ketoacyl-ACP synthase 3 [Syntrophobacteraceae bacterium]